MEVMVKMRNFLKKHRVLVISVSVVLVLLAVVVISLAKIIPTYGSYISHAVFSEIDADDLCASGIDQCDKLMIVAHPDDETLWGGAHLLDGGYFVLCITNGDNDVRADEFMKVIEETGNYGMILSYPDKVNGERSDWKHLLSNISKDVYTVVTQHEWTLIVTHNPDGEYGHNHHIMVNDIVSTECKEQGMEDKLWYFGKYYKKSVIEGSDAPYIVPLDDDKAARKAEILEIYQSQEKTRNKLEHMNGYEDWVCASDWNYEK